MSLLIYPFLWKLTWNLMNVKYDAYRIQYLDKQIRHGINGAAYFATIVISILLSDFKGWDILYFSLASLFCRQIVFDIPLNISRGLKWDYVTTDPKPKALTDRFEIALFGRNGRLPVYLYTILWFTFETILILKHT